MIKAGDMFKNIESGKIFTVKSVDPRIIILGTKDGFQSMFVNPNSIESQFVPIIEDEVKGNGIIVKSTPIAEERGIISNGVNEVRNLHPLF
jgi:hypothetical protein